MYNLPLILNISYISYREFFLLIFTNFRIREKKWTSELVLVDISGRIISFLVSPSGYQVSRLAPDRRILNWPDVAGYPVIIGDIWRTIKLGLVDISGRIISYLFLSRVSRSCT